MELSGPPRGAQSPVEPPRGEETNPIAQRETPEKHEEPTENPTEDGTQGGEGNTGGGTRRRGPSPLLTPPKKLGGVGVFPASRGVQTPIYCCFFFFFFFIHHHHLQEVRRFPRKRTRRWPPLRWRSRISSGCVSVRIPILPLLVNGGGRGGEREGFWGGETDTLTPAQPLRALAFCLSVCPSHFCSLVLDVPPLPDRRCSAKQPRSCRHSFSGESVL